jgi:hypothetical protein
MAVSLVTDGGSGVSIVALVSRHFTPAPTRKRPKNGTVATNPKTKGVTA